MCMTADVCGGGGRYEQSADHTVVHARIRLHGTFAETFELQQFPFE